MKATEHYFPVVLFIMLYKVFLTFGSVDEILNCVSSNESYRAVLSFFSTQVVFRLRRLCCFSFPGPDSPCADVERSQGSVPTKFNIPVPSWLLTPSVVEVSSGKRKSFTAVEPLLTDTSRERTTNCGPGNFLGHLH